jgi:hypothetical protein
MRNISIDTMMVIVCIAVFVAVFATAVAIWSFARYRRLSLRILVSTNKQAMLQDNSYQMQGKVNGLEEAKRLVELERDKHQLALENIRLRVDELEREKEHFMSILNSREMQEEPIRTAIRERVELLNGLVATEISDNETYAKPYTQWINKIQQDRVQFMNSTRLAFKASHPRFVEYLEAHELTEAEINYICLYALGLRGKEVGEYIQLKRHYHISSDIRKKLGIDEHETNLGLYVRKLMHKH